MILRHLRLPVKITQSQRKAGQVTVEVTRLNGKSRVRTDHQMLFSGERNVRVMEQHVTDGLLVRQGCVAQKSRLIRDVQDAQVVRRITPLAGLVRVRYRKVERCMARLGDLQAWGEIPSDENVLVLCLRRHVSALVVVCHGEHPTGWVSACQEGF